MDNKPETHGTDIVITPQPDIAYLVRVVNTAKHYDAEEQKPTSKPPLLLTYSPENKAKSFSKLDDFIEHQLALRRQAKSFRKPHLSACGGDAFAALLSFSQPKPFCVTYSCGPAKAPTLPGVRMKNTTPTRETEVMKKAIDLAYGYRIGYDPNDPDNRAVAEHLIRRDLVTMATFPAGLDKKILLDAVSLHEDIEIYDQIPVDILAVPTKVVQFIDQSNLCSIPVADWFQGFFFEVAEMVRDNYPYAGPNEGTHGMVSFRKATPETTMTILESFPVLTMDNALVEAVFLAIRLHQDKCAAGRGVRPRGTYTVEQLGRALNWPSTQWSPYFSTNHPCYRREMWLKNYIKHFSTQNKEWLTKLFYEKHMPNIHPSEATCEEARIFFATLHEQKSEIVTATSGYTFFDAVKLHKLLDLKADLTSNEVSCAREDTKRHHEHLCRMTSTHTGVVAYDWVKNYVEHTLMCAHPRNSPIIHRLPSENFAMNIFQFQDPRTAGAEHGEICLSSLVDNVPNFSTSQTCKALQIACKLRRGVDGDMRNVFGSFDEVRQAVKDVQEVSRKIQITQSTSEPRWLAWVVAFMDEVVKDVDEASKPTATPPEKTTPETKTETPYCDVLSDVLGLVKGLKDGKPVFGDSVRARRVRNLIDVAVAALSHWQAAPSTEHERIATMKNQLLSSRDLADKYIREKELEENLEVFTGLLEGASTKATLRALLGALCDLEPWEPGKLHDDRLALIAKYEAKLGNLEI